MKTYQNYTKVYKYCLYECNILFSTDWDRLMTEYKAEQRTNFGDLKRQLKAHSDQTTDDSNLSLAMGTGIMPKSLKRRLPSGKDRLLRRAAMYKIAAVVGDHVGEAEMVAL